MLQIKGKGEMHLYFLHSRLDFNYSNGDINNQPSRNTSIEANYSPPPSPALALSETLPKPTEIELPKIHRVLPRFYDKGKILTFLNSQMIS